MRKVSTPPATSVSRKAVNTTVTGCGSWKATMMRPAIGALAGWARYTRSTSTAVLLIQNSVRAAENETTESTSAWVGPL